jgi:RecA/RadA recombinase
MAKKSETTAPAAGSIWASCDELIGSSNGDAAVYKTGFPLIDYNLAYTVTMYDSSDSYNVVGSYLAKGIRAGSFNTIAGNPGTGKTTLAAQMAANIIRPFPEGRIYHIDAEEASVLTRLVKITNLDVRDFDTENNPNARYHLIIEPTDTEAFQRKVMEIHKLKQQNASVLRYNTGQKDSFNRDIIEFVPTVLILDSVPKLAKVWDVNVAADARDMLNSLSNMSGAQAAGDMKKMLRVIIPYMRQSNIIVIALTHIAPKVETGFMPTEKDMRALGKDEVLVGGKALKYDSTNILKLRSKPAGRTLDDGDGFNGYESIVTVVKSRATNDGKSFTMMYDQDNGYDSIRSLVEYGKGKGLITGQRNRTYFVSAPDLKFSLTNVNTEFESRPELWNAMKDIVIKDLEDGATNNIGTDTVHTPAIFMDY